jgi:beta-galactosidase
VNYYDLASGLDFVGWNNYPRTQWTGGGGEDPSSAALGHDAVRGLKRKNFWVLEQQAGQAGWEMVGPSPRAGELRLWAYQSIAHGADGILFFRWRTSRFGTEQYWHGLLDHDATPSRGFREIKQMGAELKMAGDLICGSTYAAGAAFVLSYDSRFAFQTQPNNPGFSYSKQFAGFYRALYRRNVAMDVVPSTADLSKYALVLAPALHVVTQAIADNLRRFVRAGGVLVITPRSGVKDEANAVVNRRLPGLLAEMSGVEVEEYDSLPPDNGSALEFVLPELAAASPTPALIWCDVLKPTTAAVVARYLGGNGSGKPAITLNHFGEGQVVYVGTCGDESFYSHFAGWLAELAGLRGNVASPEGVEVCERRQGERRLVFILNHTESEQEITLDGRLFDLLDSAKPSVGRIRVEPRDVRLLMEG